ncbi:MAG: uroporphyrinogen-III synthase [Taibaiella sp.]|nr:uroporphyrinogen-III synthase [Taibaiella sp.]
MREKISILSTAAIGKDVEQAVADRGIVLDVIPFIDTVYIEDVEVSERVKGLAAEKAVVVFTSKHAVMSVAKMVGKETVKWSIYCLGNKTKNVVNQCFVSSENLVNAEIIKGVGDDAEQLANVIIKQNVKKVVFFCGDKRLDILPEILAKAGVDIVEIIVYRTLETPQKVEEKYDGILFYSPSGVRSFFNVNKVFGSTVLFAIGKTTADAIGQYADNKIVISSAPVKKQVFMTAIDYFNSSKWGKYLKIN